MLNTISEIGVPVVLPSNSSAIAFQNDTRTRKELQKIIEKMLNINDLDQTIAALNAVASSIGQSSSNSRLDSELAKAKNILQEKKQALDNATEDIDRNAKEPYAVGYTAESIVICPVNPGTKRYSADKDAAIWLKELTDSVITTYSVDTSKNVISGGSSGGCSALMMAAYYNDYYTDCISLDGDFSTKNFEKYTMETQGRRLAKVNVYTFNAVDDHEICPIKETDTMRDASQAEGGFFNVNRVGGKHGAGISSAIGPKSTGLSDIIKRINER